jgi:putative tricarboxylic transport membrane protein
MFEAQLRRALSISQGDPMTLVQSPFAVFVYAALGLVFALSLWLKRREKETEEVLEHLEDDELVSTDERSERS